MFVVRRLHSLIYATLRVRIEQENKFDVERHGPQERDEEAEEEG